ncbi:MAG: hypothetical protein ACOX7P_02170 [Oscillospiraceae bacterium]|jgi:uncharacterized membrane protein
MINWRIDIDNLFSGANIAVMIIAVVVWLAVILLSILICYLLMRTAVKNGVDRSDLARFLRQAKLLELRDKGLIPEEETQHRK